MNKSEELGKKSEELWEIYLKEGDELSLKAYKEADKIYLESLGEDYKNGRTLLSILDVIHIRDAARRAKIFSGFYTSEKNNE